ncbi:MAG: FAD-binding protein, partial [Bifidobacteriaceae bacterium]|nr:FAD-binding protein [Bifidobacteriaceae bacterium]
MRSNGRSAHEGGAGTSLSRRGFLKGAASAGAIVAVGGLSACTPESASDPDNDPAAGPNLPSWENPPDPIADGDIVETVDTEVVIVGAGMAGMAAFMWAAEAGAGTVIIEKLDSYSGRGLDFAAIGSKVQQAAGITIDKGRLVGDLMKASGGKARGRLIELWADKSSEVFDRLIDMTVADGGEVVLGAGSAASADAEDFTTRTYPTDHMFGGLVQGSLDLIGRMERAGQSAGGQSFYNTKAEQLTRDGTGRITGVVATNPSGEYVRYNASRGVILATGDYGNNPEMVAAWCPLVEKVDGSIYPNPEGNTGDGINMALWSGGTIQPSAHAAMVHPVFGGGAMSTASYMKVDGSGRRFCNESTTLPGISNMYLTSPKRI